MPRFTDFFTDFEKKNPTFLQSRIVESTRNAFISFNSAINFVQFLYKNVQLTNKIVFAFNKKIRSTFVKYAPFPPPPPKKKNPGGENNKVHGVSSGSILPELFFQPIARSQILFLDRRLACTGFFFLPIWTCGMFFSNYPPTHRLTRK